MLKRDDVVDLIMRHLKEPGKGARTAEAEKATRPWGIPEAAGRLFLSEYDIKKRLTPGAQHLTIPQGAIISPLALDWLTLKGIKVEEK